MKTANDFNDRPCYRTLENIPIVIGIAWIEYLYQCLGEYRDLLREWEQADGYRRPVLEHELSMKREFLMRYV